MVSRVSKEQRITNLQVQLADLQTSNRKNRKLLTSKTRAERLATSKKERYEVANNQLVADKAKLVLNSQDT